MIAGEIWKQNPLIVLPRWTFSIVDLFLRCNRAGSPLGGRPLPCPGTMGEQPAALMDAFDLLDMWMQPDAEPAG